jgi:gliding motility-associated-like protein
MKYFKLLTILIFFTISHSVLSQSCEMFAPNSFTPNNDGYNDFWEVVIPDSCYTKYECKIYDKYGSMIWESYDPMDRWCGSIMSGTYYAQNGLYQYLIIVNNTKTSGRYVGNIRLIR